MNGAIGKQMFYQSVTPWKMFISGPAGMLLIFQTLEYLMQEQMFLIMLMYHYSV